MVVETQRIHPRGPLGIGSYFPERDPYFSKRKRKLRSSSTLVSKGSGTETLQSPLSIVTQRRFLVLGPKSRNPSQNRDETERVTVTIPEGEESQSLLEKIGISDFGRYGQTPKKQTFSPSDC